MGNMSVRNVLLSLVSPWATKLTRELVPGRQYIRKKSGEIWVYVGFHPWFELEAINAKQMCEATKQVYKGQKHVFWNGTSFDVPYVCTFAGEVSADVVEGFAGIVDAFFSTPHAQKIVGFTFEPLPRGELTYAYGDRLVTFDEKNETLGVVCFPSRVMADLRFGGRRPPRMDLEIAKFFYTFRDGFTLDWNARKVECSTISFQEGGDPDAPFNASDIQMTQEGYLKAVFSTRLTDFYRNKGVGILKYVLENGKHAKIGGELHGE